jgi:N utilization substance protein A
VLADFGVSRAEAEQMVVAARLKVGWITEEDLLVEEEEAGEEAEKEGVGAL